MGKYYELSDGTLGPFPEGRRAAARASSRVYTDLKGCKNCPSKTFITASGRCVSCMRDQITAVWMFNAIPEGDKSYRPVFNLPDNFEPIKEAHEAVKLLKNGEGFKLGKEVCSDYGHIKLTNNKYHRCYFCETQGNKQEQAKQNNDEHYLTRSKCGGCGIVTLRNTKDTSCVECGHLPNTRKGSVSPTTQMMLDNPDMIISREDAIDLGMVVYRTGEECKHGHKAWRYVTTGNCIKCMRGAHRGY